MNKYIYIATDTINISNPSGVCKKVIAQCNVLSSVNDTYLLNFSGIFHFKKGSMLEVRRSLLASRFRRLKLFKEVIRFTKGYAFNVYIRYPYSDPFFIILLLKLKKQGCKIVIEIPTYPYKKNHDGDIYSYLRLWCDSFFSMFLRAFVDRIVSYSDDKTIFGIPTINTINGVDFSKIKLVKREGRKPDQINLVAVAHLYACHGYDRIIKGIALYNKENPKIKVIFNIVGNGEEYDNLKALIDKYDVEESVNLLGFKSGSSLDNIYDHSDIAVNSLAIHRIGLEKESTLKAKEYCAKGLPIISSYPIDSLTEVDNNKYVLQVSLDDTPIDIVEVVKFYKRLSHIDNLNEEIRAKSMGICDMSITLKPVVEFFNM